MDFDCIFQKICLIVFYRYSFERSCWWQVVDMPKYAKEIVIRVFLKNSWPENRVFMATINQMKKRHAIINQEINTETNQMKDWTRKRKIDFIIGVALQIYLLFPWVQHYTIYGYLFNTLKMNDYIQMYNKALLPSLKGLKRSYLVNETKIDVLKGINLTINNQEFIAIMGKSGSGKTTLLKLLGLLDRPTEGKVFFKGEDSNSLRGDRLAMIRRREIGFIYQDYYLMDSLSVRENIMLPKILDHSPVEESITEAEKLADIMGVRALLDKKIFELSGGEKQRAAICRALMNHSDLILADEPTGNLDSASSETVMEYLQMINKDLKKAVVLVTHDAYVASFCDRVIFVKDGNIEVELRKKEKQDVFCDKIMKAQKDILKNK